MIKLTKPKIGPCGTPMLNNEKKSIKAYVQTTNVTDYYKTNVLKPYNEQQEPSNVSKNTIEAGIWWPGNLLFN